MKAKQIKRSLFAILLIAVLMVVTSVVSVGAATQKTYLDSMLYTEETNAVEYGVCNLTKFDGGFNNGVTHADCKNALRVSMETSKYHNWDPNYQENSDRAMYKVTYNLKNNYDNFYAGLISSTGNAQFVNVKIYTDEICVYDNNLTSLSDYQNISVNVKNSNELTFVMVLPYSFGYSTCQLVIDNAYLTSEGTTPEPTTEEPEPTQKPTLAPTTPVVKPTIAPTTNSTLNPTKDVEDTTTDTKATTSTEETTSSNIKPTASQNAKSRVSTSDTATNDSINNDNGTIQTGAISIAVIIFLLLSSLAIGGFALYRKKTNKS